MARKIDRVFIRWKPRGLPCSVMRYVVGVTEGLLSATLVSAGLICARLDEPKARD
jgi:hypothetical protein